MGWLDDIKGKAAEFAQQDAARRSGIAGDPAVAAIEDRRREGALMRALLGPVAPAATVPVAGAAFGYEGLKDLAQRTGLGEALPGPFKVDSSTSPANMENAIALMRGFTGSR